jgi:hypothetical protein
MTLGAVTKGKEAKPSRVVCYAPEGIGKSTFAAGAPSPIFLDAESGTSHLDVARFPAPETWADVLDAVQVLRQDEHAYQTLVIDTLDAVEPLLWAHICAEAGVRSIEEVGGGYGKGYVAAVDGWRRLLASLEALQRTRGMHVVLLAHSQVKAFRSPDAEDWERYTLRLHERSAGVIKEWADDVLFANLEIVTARDQKTKRVRGISTGARLAHTVRTAAFDAKSRSGLPETMPLAWSEFAAAIESGSPAPTTDIADAITENAQSLRDDLKKKALDALKRAGKDARKLEQLNNWVTAKLAEEEN